jgi:hypothetical protein
MRGLGRYNKVEAEFKTNWGPTVYARTATEPDSVVGIPRIRAGWLDEAGKVSLYFSENIRTRIVATGGRMLYTTSPYSRNWIWKDYIKPKLDGALGLEDLKLIQAPSWENPYHQLYDVEVRRKERERMDPRRFAMVYGGEWTAGVGLVYDCWDEDLNLVPSFELPQGTKYFGGLDWGFTDPFVLKVRAITPDGRHYGVSEFYKTGMTLPDMMEVSRQKKQVFGITCFYADPSQPGHIEEFNRNGLPCLPADNDIRRGVDLHYELIKTRRYKEFEGACPYSLDERQSYHYGEPKDLGPDDDSKEQLPVGQNDHCMDVDRYLTMMTYRTGTRLVPRVPGEVKKLETNQERIARLKRVRSGGSGNTENWS